MPDPFRYDAAVAPGEKRHFRHEVSETYLGDPVEIPVTVINGAHDGPVVFLSAALHGDELNGVKVLQEVASGYQPTEIHGTLVCLHVLNVPGFQAQTRDIPIYDQDLNRCFPGRARSNTAERIANEVFETFVRPCDFGLDFHTSTRNRTTMYHVRADTESEGAERLAKAFGANIVLNGAGEEGSLRGCATRNGTPTLTVEMGKAHRFQRALIDRAVAGVKSALAALNCLPDAAADYPGWRRVVDAEREKTWLRADQGGLVEMKWGPHPVVREGEAVCTISDHFGREEHAVTAPFDGLLLGVLENPLALPGHPLCHLVRIDDDTHEEIRREIASGEFDGYRADGLRWMGDGEEME